MKLKFAKYCIFLALLSLLNSPITKNTDLVREYKLKVGTYLRPAREKVRISNWTHPTPQDYRVIQKYLKHAPRPELKYINYPGTTFREERIRKFKLIEKHRDPVFEVLHLNESSYNKKNCIVTYISFDKRYEEHLHNLIAQLKLIGFDGDLIYRIGGWPNTEEGSLQFFDVPYGFKVYSILEAKRLGYKNCLWLDACFLPLKKLDPIFDHIDKYGFFLLMSPGSDRPTKMLDAGYVQEFASKALAHITSTKFRQLPITTSSMVGIDFTNDRGLKILYAWKEMIEQKLGCLSFIPEMAPLFVLVDRFKLFPYNPNPAYYAEPGQANSDTILFWNHH